MHNLYPFYPKPTPYESHYFTFKPLLAACRKSDTFKTAKMLRGDWRMTEKYIDDGYDTTFKGNRVPGSCLEDDVTTFKKNGAYKLDIKGTTCTEGAGKECNWTLQDESTIVFYGSAAPDSTKAQIAELSENRLILNETRTNGAVTLKGTFVYQRID